MKRHRNPLSRNLSKLAVCGGAAAWLWASAALGQTIPNPSFEANSFTVWPGYLSDNAPITDWIGTPPERVGLNPASGSPFADNGTIPHGNNVAFIQANVSDPGNPSTLKTTITGLTPGITYKVTFRANARAGNTPNIKVYMDGAGVLLPSAFVDGLSTAAVGSANPYWVVAFEWMATATAQELSIVNDASGDHTVLVDDFQIAPSAGKWTIAQWMWDGDIGVDPTFFYTHAYNFGNATNFTINTVPFTGIPGNAPAVPGRFSATYLAAGPVQDTSVNVWGDCAALGSHFVYGGNVPAGLYQSVTVQGLTPGVEYVMTIYSVAWEDPSVGSRWATFSVGNDYLTVNQDQFYNNNAILIAYRYTADASGAVTMKFAPLVPANVSFHVYGFSNREAESRFVTPVITVQPKSQTVSPGLDVSFSVVASGVPTPTYQWRRNGTAIQDATDATLALSAVTAGDAGNYDVLVANVAGSVPSSVARLTVGVPIVNPSFEADIFYVWPGYVSGNTPITGWTALGGHGLNPVFDGGSPFANNGAIPHGSQVAFMQAVGALSQVVSGLTVGGEYYVHYFENARTSVTIPGMEVKVGTTTVVPAHSVPPVLGGNPYREIASAMFTASAADMELSFNKSSPVGGDCTALIDNVAVVQVPAGTPPAIGVQPDPMTLYLNQPAWFAALAQGSLPLHFQWRLNGTPVAGATDNILVLPSVRLSDEGDYTLVVTNNYGAVTSRVARLSLLESITSLLSTGIDASGSPQPAGTITPYWTLLVNPDGGSPNVYVANEGWPIQAGVWMVNTPASKWVGSRAAVGAGDIAAGNYIYRTQFDLTGRDTNTVVINGRWATDNTGIAVYLNGATVPVPLSGGFGGWTAFSLGTNNATFLPGTNVLDFEMNNASAGPAGIRVEFTSTSARTLPGIPAAIAGHPHGATLAEGDSVTLNVTTTGTLPITYQWKKNGADLPGKTDASLTLTAVTTNDTANYSVGVTNLWGGAVSANAPVVIAFRPLPGFFGTGVDASGALLADGAVDPHYILAASADPNYPGPEAFVVHQTWPIAPAGPWAANGPTSKWIAPRAEQEQNLDPSLGNAEGDYTYQTTFDLTGRDHTKIVVVGTLAVDNSVSDVLVNGLSTGITAPSFSTYTDFAISSGLIPGVNTLDFKAYNAPATPNPAGLRVNLKGYLNILPPVTLQITRSGNQVTISWAPTLVGQKLLSAPAVTGPWTEVPNAPNPYTTTAGAAKAFYRVSQ